MSRNQHRHLDVAINSADQLRGCDVSDFLPNSFDSEDRSKFGTDSASTSFRIIQSSVRGGESYLARSKNASGSFPISIADPTHGSQYATCGALCFLEVNMLKPLVRFINTQTSRRKVMQAEAR